MSEPVNITIHLSVSKLSTREWVLTYLWKTLSQCPAIRNLRIYPDEEAKGGLIFVG